MVIQNLFSKSNFDDTSLGLLSDADYQKIFAAGSGRSLQIARYNPQTNRPSIFDMDGFRVLGHFFKQGFFGVQTGINQNSRVNNTINQTDQELWWGFHFKFQAGFSYSIAGKFFGLGVGTNPASGGMGPASSMIANNKGASVRIAPRETSTGIRFALYVYDYNLTGKYGSAPGGFFGQVTPGQWQQIVVRTRINPDPNVKNGICQVWLDGVLVLSVNTLWLNHPQTPWDRFGEFFVNSFMGGAGSSFASRQDQYIYQRDFHLWRVTSGGLGQTLYSPSAEIITPMGIINDSGGTPPDPEVPSNPPTGNITTNISTTTNSAIISFTYSGSDVTGFEYRLNSGSTLPATSPISFTSLTPSTSYTIEIRAVNSNGAGSWFSSAFLTQALVSTEPPIVLNSGAKKIKHKPVQL